MEELCQLTISLQKFFLYLFRKQHPLLSYFIFIIIKTLVLRTRGDDFTEIIFSDVLRFNIRFISGHFQTAQVLKMITCFLNLTKLISYNKNIIALNNM